MITGVVVSGLVAAMTETTPANSRQSNDVLPDCIFNPAFRDYDSWMGASKRSLCNWCRQVLYSFDRQAVYEELRRALPSSWWQTRLLTN